MLIEIVKCHYKVSTTLGCGTDTKLLRGIFLNQKDAELLTALLGWGGTAQQISDTFQTAQQ